MTPPRRARPRKPPQQSVPIDEAIAHMPESHLHCRDYCHAWRRLSARYVPDQHVYEQDLRCASCKTIRRRLIDERGGLVRSAYEYAERYLVKGVGRMDGDMRAAVRLASVLSTIVPRSNDRRSA